MNTEYRGLVDIDWQNFTPWRIQSATHRLMEHPLLQPDQLVELGRRLESGGGVRTHTQAATAGTPFDTAPRLHPNRKSAVETLQQIKDAKAWMSLLNVQIDPVYRTLVDEVLDDVKPGIDRFDPGMCYRGGWIFVSSPNTVTPFHFDKEHNIILQIRGRKTLYVWENDDTVAASESARDRFHASHERDRLNWREELRERARIFHLEPGQGAYMPSTSPHLVENGDEPSITMSFTFYTDSTRRDSALHKMHERLRGIGIEPPPVGANKTLDSMLLALQRGAVASKEAFDKVAGKPIYPDSSPYAFSSVY